MQPANKPTGKISLLALGVALAIGVMFFYGKKSITVDQTSPVAAASVAAQVTSGNTQAGAEAPWVEEMVVTAQRIEVTPVGFNAPKPKVAIAAPVAPKTFWPQS